MPRRNEKKKAVIEHRHVAVKRESALVALISQVQICSRGLRAVLPDETPAVIFYLPAFGPDILARFPLQPIKKILEIPVAFIAPVVLPVEACQPASALQDLRIIGVAEINSGGRQPMAFNQCFQLAHQGVGSLGISGRTQQARTGHRAVRGGD
jgi:hypothetical protein